MGTRESRPKPHPLDKVTVSPLVAKRYNLKRRSNEAPVRVTGTPGTDADHPRIHLIAWEELPQQRAAGDSPKLVVIANRAGEPDQREAARRGAAALIALDRLHEDLEPAIQAVAAGFYPLPADVASAVASRLETPPPSIGADNLTLLNQLLEGANVADLAGELGCSERHARRKLRAIWDQMGVAGRREGLATAARWGLPE